ncbi:hypothetical protein HMPREF9072_02263 [Capnocytophaga sp. oral taxon 324 str. F0483]|nr:hypothetical protein HMPREF9072_02263 [Capnocytophaga sp. oral taxon 324 str. F0483]
MAKLKTNLINHIFVTFVGGVLQRLFKAKLSEQALFTFYLLPFTY